MSKFLKFIVNVILLCAIVVAGGLLIPPFVGVTTVIVDDVDMETNLARGSVTYAIEQESSQVKIGNKVLVNEGESQYVYEVEAVNGESYTLEDKLSTDGQTKEMSLGSTVKKVLFTVPFAGYVTMALRTTEGLIIVGLAVVFVIILFILAEIWKKDEDEEDEDEEEEAAGAAETADDTADEEPRMSRKERKKAKKAEKKAAKAVKKAGKKGKESQDEEAARSNKAEVLPEEGKERQKEDAGNSKVSEEDQKLFDETGSSLAANIADMFGEGTAAGTEPEGQENVTIDAVRIEASMVMEEEAAAASEDQLQMRRLAMPVYTKEELMEKAKAAGEEPDIVEDEASGITFLDYSDIL